MADGIFISKHLLEKRFYNFPEHIQVSRIHKMNLSMLSFAILSKFLLLRLAFIQRHPALSLKDCHSPFHLAVTG